MEPYQGQWQFDLDATLEQRRVGGASEDELEQTRQVAEAMSALGGLHPDLTFQGNEAVSAEPLVSEYRFFALHEHDESESGKNDGFLCGKAWHHEDRYDPGDMSKCWVRLALVNDHLHFQVRMQNGIPAWEDPDLSVTDQVAGGSQADCPSNSLASDQWTDWMTNVFTRTRKH